MWEAPPFTWQPSAGALSVGQWAGSNAVEAIRSGNNLAGLGWSMLGAANSVLTPGGDQLSTVNAKAWNGQEVSNKELTTAGGLALTHVALTAAPQFGLSGGTNSVFWSGYSKGAQGAAQELGTTIEKTPVGIILDKALNSDFANMFIPGAVKNEVWKTASGMFAANADGTALAVIRNAGQVWTNIESKILISRGVSILLM
jgi:hypothetical protein